MDKFVENEADFKTKQTEQAQREFVEKEIKLEKNPDNNDLLLQVFKLSATSTSHVKGEKALKATSTSHVKGEKALKATSTSHVKGKEALEAMFKAVNDDTGKLKKTFSLSDPNKASSGETFI